MVRKCFFNSTLPGLIALFNNYVTKYYKPYYYFDALTNSLHSLRISQRSKTHQKDETNVKHKKTSQDNKSTSRKSVFPNKHQPEEKKASDKKASIILRILNLHISSLEKN